MKKYGFWFLARRTLKLMVYYRTISFRHTSISYRGREFGVEMADTREKMQLGLSFRKELPRDRGIVFVYKKLEPHIIWMLNTTISLDIIWLDARGRIVHLEERAPPRRSLTDFKIFEPTERSLYVIEFPAGTVEKYGMTKGSTIDITHMAGSSEHRGKT
jgi:hypothetical protein